jgi:uncharacterized UBP type Zn finger protein
VDRRYGVGDRMTVDVDERFDWLMDHLEDEDQDDPVAPEIPPTESDQ